MDDPVLKPAPHRLRWLWWLFLIPLLLLGGFAAWGLIIPAPMPEALDAMKSDGFVTVREGEWLNFTPPGLSATTGLILYPGARVDPRAYAPMAHRIASLGYQVVIVPMPLNFAVLGVNRADQVIQAYPNIQHWAIGGHSLGGAMAAEYAGKHIDKIDGLVLWAAYPAKSNDLSKTGLLVTSISANLDGLASPEKIIASRPLLPLGTRYAEIQGGNHAHFGWYGEQSGDNPATLSREIQQSVIVAETVRLLGRVGTNQ